MIKLADKNYLLPALQACETFIATFIATSPPQITLNPYEHPAERLSRFGYLCLGNNSEWFTLDLPFLELLLKVQMTRAFDSLAPQYMRLLCNECAQAREQRKAHI